MLESWLCWETEFFSVSCWLCLLVAERRLTNYSLGKQDSILFPIGLSSLLGTCPICFGLWPAAERQRLGA